MVGSGRGLPSLPSSTSSATACSSDFPTWPRSCQPTRSRYSFQECYSQRNAYDKVFNTLREALSKAFTSGSKRLLATYLQTLLAYPDGCTWGETVFDPRTQEIIVQVPPLSEETLYPKEKGAPLAAERISHLFGGRFGSIIDRLFVEFRVLYFQQIVVWLELYGAPSFKSPWCCTSPTHLSRQHVFDGV